MSREPSVPQPGTAQPGPPPPFSPEPPAPPAPGGAPGTPLLGVPAVPSGPTGTPLLGVPIPEPSVTERQPEQPQPAYQQPPALQQPPVAPLPQPQQPQVRRPPVWHRLHYPIGVFLVMYGLSSMISGMLGASDRKMELTKYVPAHNAGTLLTALKAIEAMLLLLCLVGLLRRRYVWFLPGLLGWFGGFAVFCVLDIWKGNLGGLAEHLGYALAFGLLLFLTYGLGAKANAARRPLLPVHNPASLSPTGLSRTQEIALNALSRWQRVPPPQ